MLLLILNGLSSNVYYNLVPSNFKSTRSFLINDIWMYIKLNDLRKIVVVN